MTPRRVVCLVDSDNGTAVEYLGRGRYRVEWDHPTPYQDQARVPIPSAQFDWAFSIAATSSKETKR